MNESVHLTMSQCSTRAASHSWLEWEKRAEGDLHEVKPPWLEWEKRAEGDLHEVRDE